MGFSRQEYWSGLPLPSPRVGHDWATPSLDSHKKAKTQSSLSQSSLVMLKDKLRSIKNMSIYLSNANWLEALCRRKLGNRFYRAQVEAKEVVLWPSCWIRLTADITKGFVEMGIIWRPQNNLKLSISHPSFQEPSETPTRCKMLQCPFPHLPCSSSLLPSQAALGSVDCFYSTRPLNSPRNILSPNKSTCAIDAPSTPLVRRTQEPWDFLLHGAPSLQEPSLKHLLSC